MKTRDFIQQTPYIAWALMFATLCWGLFSNFFGSLTPNIATDLGLIPQDLGLIIVIMSAGGILGAFLGGDIAHRFPPRYLLLAYLGCIFVSIVFITVTKRFGLICLGYCLYTISTTAMMTVSHSMLAYLKLGYGMRPRLLALLDVGFSVGATLSPLWVALLLLVHQNWRLPYIVFLLPLFVIVFSLLHNRANRDFTQLVVDTTEPINIQKQNSNQASYLELIMAPWARWTWLCGVLVGYVEWGNAYWFVNYATNGRAIDINYARIGLAAFTGGMMSIRAWQAFYHSQWSAEMRMKRFSLIGLSMFVILAALPNHAHVVYISIVGFFAGIGIGIVFPMLLNHLIEIAPQNTAKCSALLMLFVILGSQIAGMTIGLLATHLGIFVGYATIMLSMAGFTYGVWQIYADHPLPLASIEL